jgi:hypothetical protein
MSTCGCQKNKVKHPVNQKGGERATETRNTAPANEAALLEPSVSISLVTVACQPLRFAWSVQTDRWGDLGSGCSKFLCSDPSIAGISDQPPAIVTTIDYLASSPNVTLPQQFITQFSVHFLTIRVSHKAVGAKGLSGGKRVYVDLPHPFCSRISTFLQLCDFLVHFVNPTFTTPLRFFQSAYENSTSPNDYLDPGINCSPHATRHTCGSATPSLTIVLRLTLRRLCYWTSEQIWRGLHGSLYADDYEFSLLSLLACIDSQSRWCSTRFLVFV